MNEQLTPREARQGIQVKGMRHVLFIGIAGVAVAFLLVGLLIGF
ncbi:hypothetical protein BH10PSE7_BH10PSE7_28890 [soil metagenome]